MQLIYFRKYPALVQNVKHHKQIVYMVSLLLIHFPHFSLAWLVHSNRLSDSFRGRSSTCARLLDRVLLQGSSWSKPSNTLGCARRVCARYHSSRALSQTSSTAAPPFCKDRISIYLDPKNAQFRYFHTFG